LWEEASVLGIALYLSSGWLLRWTGWCQFDERRLLCYPHASVHRTLNNYCLFYSKLIDGNTLLFLFWTERRKKASAWERNLVYPAVMILLLIETVRTVFFLKEELWGILQSFGDVALKILSLSNKLNTFPDDFERTYHYEFRGGYTYSLFKCGMLLIN